MTLQSHLCLWGESLHQPSSCFLNPKFGTSCRLTRVRQSLGFHFITLYWWSCVKKWKNACPHPSSLNLEITNGFLCLDLWNVHNWLEKPKEMMNFSLSRLVSKQIFRLNYEFIMHLDLKLLTLAYSYWSCVNWEWEYPSGSLNGSRVESMVSLQFYLLDRELHVGRTREQCDREALIIHWRSWWDSDQH